MSYSFFLNSALSLIMYSLNISNSFYNDSVREVVRREVVTIGDALLLTLVLIYLMIRMHLFEIDVAIFQQNASSKLVVSTENA